LPRPFRWGGAPNKGIAKATPTKGKSSREFSYRRGCGDEILKRELVDDSL
jgi:hypothetical protein